MRVNLTSRQKQYLKGLAHPLEPVVRVGRGGVKESVAAETRKSLQSHELIKVRIDSDDSADRKVLAAELASAADAAIAGMVGKIAILYRQRDEEPEIELPGV